MANEHLIPKEVRDLIAREGSQQREVDYNWIENLIAVITELDRNPKTQIDKFQLHPPVSDFVKETMGDGIGFELPHAIMSYYKIADGMELEWSYLEDGTFKPGGAINLYGYGEVFGSWLNILWGVTEDGADEDEVDFSWEIRAIDAGSSTNEFLTVMHTPENLPSFNLYHREPGGKTYGLDTDFLDYLDAMLEARGVNGWQYLVVDEADRENEDVIAAAKDATALFDSLFTRKSNRHVRFTAESE